VSRPRSSAVELQRRIESAATLLAEGAPRTLAVSQLAERFRIDRRTAQRYVAAAAQQLIVEVGADDLRGTLAESVERLRRLAYVAEQQGNLNAAVGAEKAAAATMVAIHRSDWLAVARLAGHTLATVEPSEAERRRYRQISDQLQF
jgi:DNA-binding transcriptional regulator LsrR (DeoR family)